jgi:hypothetical protein
VGLCSNWKAVMGQRWLLWLSNIVQANLNSSGGCRVSLLANSL